MKKKLLSLLLAAAMVCSCASAAWAEELTDYAPAELRAVMSETATLLDKPGQSAEAGPRESDPQTEPEGPAQVETPAVPTPVPDPGECQLTVKEDQEEPEEPESEEPEPEEPQPEEPKPEEPDPEEPQPVEPEPEEPQPEEPKPEEPQPEKPQPEKPNPEQPQPEEPSIPGIEETKKEFLVTLTQSPSESFSRLQTAIQLGSAAHKPIRIAKAGIYRLCKTSASNIPLYLYPGTTLDLGGATLVRDGVIGNFIILCDAQGSRTATGYDLAKNITVKNGTIDGSGGRVVDCNLVNVGHSTNVVFSHVNFRNGRGAHLLELTGCKNCRVEYCTFSGYTTSSIANEPGEALQIDICYAPGGRNVPWNGIYVTDGTPCKNITVTGCTFLNYPAGIGNHHTLKKAHSSGIVITKNTFKNTKTYRNSKGKVSKQPAIRCYAFENSEVSGNVIIGNYSQGIEVNGGSVSVKNNKIGTASSYVPYPAVVESTCLEWKRGTSNRSTRKVLGVSGGSITGNVIYCASGIPAVTLYEKTHLSSVSGNTIFSSQNAAVYLEQASVSALSNNKVTCKGGTAFYLSKSSVTNALGNTVTKAKGHGFYLVSSRITGKLSQNTIQSCGKSGIYVAASSTVKTVQSNRVSQCKKYGIAILNKKLKVNVTKNTLTKNKKNLYIKAKGKIQKK